METFQAILHGHSNANIIDLWVNCSIHVATCIDHKLYNTWESGNILSVGNVMRSINQGNASDAELLLKYTKE